MQEIIVGAPEDWGWATWDVRLEARPTPRKLLELIETLRADGVLVIARAGWRVIKLCGPEADVRAAVAKHFAKVS